MNMGMVDITTLCEYKLLHTLELSYCGKLADISPLAQCSSLHTLDVKSCRQILDVSGLTKSDSLKEFYLLNDIMLVFLPQDGRAKAFRQALASIAIARGGGGGLAGCAFGGARTCVGAPCGAKLFLDRFFLPCLFDHRHLK